MSKIKKDLICLGFHCMPDYDFTSLGTISPHIKDILKVYNNKIL